MHKRDSQIYILAESGEVIERRIRPEPERFDAVLGTRPRARIVIEASIDSSRPSLADGPPGLTGPITCQNHADISLVNNTGTRPGRISRGCHLAAGTTASIAAPQS